MTYLALIREHDDAEHRFQAALRGVSLPDREGRVHGLRQQQMRAMKARRGGH